MSRPVSNLHRYVADLVNLQNVAALQGPLRPVLRGISQDLRGGKPALCLGVRVRVASPRCMQTYLAPSGMTLCGAHLQVTRQASGTARAQVC